MQRFFNLVVSGAVTGAIYSMMAAGLGVPLGPLVGGLLLEHFWWGSIFLINVVVVVIALTAGFFLIPRSREKIHAPLDPLGALLSIAGLASLVYGKASGS